MNKPIVKIIFVSILFITLSKTLDAIDIFPRNIFIEHYDIIPPLGVVKSIATSTTQLFAVSDNNLLIINKTDFSLERSVFFSEDIDLVAYDHVFDEIWLSGNNKVVRYNINLGSIREYLIPGQIVGIGICDEFVYLETEKKYSLNRTSGDLHTNPSLPQNLRMFKKTTETDITNYRFLMPYYYLDDLQESQVPFLQFAITSVYDDGMQLYVGTDRYGLMKYNKLTWNKERVVYGPLDSKIIKARKINERIYFVSSSGVSILGSETSTNWQYRRLTSAVNDIIPLDSNLVVSQLNTISSLTGAMTFPISTLDNTIITLGFDNNAIYAGTNDGMFKIVKGTREPLQFGPDKYPVHVIFPVDNGLFVGGEAGFYHFNSITKTWKILMKRGIKDISRLNNEFYMLTLDNQLIRYRTGQEDTSSTEDTTWIFLPYFNVYDIDTDGEALYCASFAGVNYYNPATNFYYAINNLPRIKYNYIFVADGNLFAVSDQGIFRLPLKYRD